MSRQFIILFISLFAHAALAQVFDDFSDQEFTSNPQWTTSNDALWQVSSGELQSNSTSAASYWITTPSTTALNAEWEFTVKLLFSTSGANYVDVFLTSDNYDLANASNGYFVRVGDTQDEIVLYILEAGTETAIIDEAEGVVNSSSNNNFRIRITRDNNNLWTLFYDDGLTGSFIIAGSATDNSINSSNYFGILIEQSGAAGPVGNHFFDDITVTGDSFIDTSPPELTTLTTLLPNEIILQFNEGLDEPSVINISNYFLNNGYGNPIEAMLTSSNEVKITYANNFVNDNYQLSIENIADVSGNTITPLQTSFNVFIPDEAQLRDVIISEILADPTPIVSLPEGDFIELFNNSDKTFDLEEWTLSDNAGSSVLPSYILQPGDYLILCTTSLLDEYSTFGATLGVTSFPNFNNAGDLVELKNDAGELIDVMNYEDSWYQDDSKSDGGYSLELVNPLNICGGADNWRASNSATGGTPGVQNSVFDESSTDELPEVVSLRATDETEVIIEFSEILDSTSIDISDFSIDPTTEIANLQLNDNILHLLLSEPLQNSVIYQLTVQNLDDCTSNTLTTITLPFELIVNPPLSFKEVIITEIMANPNEETELPNTEYVELYNNSTTNLNLENWVFSDTSDSVTLPFYILTSNEYVILTDESAVPMFEANVQVIGLSLPTLNNSGDALTLKTEANELLDSVNYNASWYRSSIKDDGGFSLEIIDVNDFCSDALNWIATESPTGGTPGQQNSVFSTIQDNMGPNLIAAFGISPDTILLEFNELLDEASIGSAIFELSDNLLIDEVVSENLMTIFVILQENTQLATGESYTISISNVTDCPGNLINQNTAVFSLIESAEINDIILNEILFNPRPGGVDFVELYNNSQKFINLQGWHLANAAFINDTLVVDTKRRITDEVLIFAPNEYLAITSDPIILKNQYPKSVEENILSLSSLPSYPDNEGATVLLNQRDSVYDLFEYSEDFHASIVSDEEGVSLERISFSENTNNAENWFSAAQSQDFATPGYLNSQAQESLGSVGTVNIEPPIITPDGDGMNDFTTINYEFDKPGFVATIKILDLNGRTVKEIAENDFLSTTGFYTWDGSDNNNSLVRMGYYIIYIETFHPDGDLQTFKEKVVIGTRF